MAGAHDIGSALADVREKIAAAHDASVCQNPPRLVAVSKYKPVSALQEAYGAGQRVFGENYVQELLGKVPQMPPDVEWHFIGHLQSNKAMRLVKGSPNLSVVETVDSVKLANQLNKASGASLAAMAAADGGGEGGGGGGGGGGSATESASGAVPAGRTTRLGVMVQVNTSGEASKSGLPPATESRDCIDLALHIARQCPHLDFRGFMTIGGRGPERAAECFELLGRCRAALCGIDGGGDGAADPPLQFNESEVELSMGMSADYELAIAHGSTNVRIGSTIFGARDESAMAAAREKEAAADADADADRSTSGSQ